MMIRVNPIFDYASFVLKHNSLASEGIDAESSLNATRGNGNSKSFSPILSPGGDEPDNPDLGPDLLVLGFQELDRSAEAYIYSTNVAREEAWCTAATAALGERGPQYEKVKAPTFYTAKDLIKDS